jgi:hypothetical protein
VANKIEHRQAIAMGDDGFAVEIGRGRAIHTRQSIRPVNS